MNHCSNEKFAAAIQRQSCQIINRERKRRMFKTISHHLRPGDTTTGGLARLNIPSCGHDQPFPIGPDPKTWSGPWTTITNPEVIAQHVCAANHRQYHQAHDTPFASEPLLSLFGYQGDTPAADALLHGELPPPSITNVLLPETNQILARLAEQTTSPQFNTEISPSDFSSFYKILKEKTS